TVKQFRRRMVVDIVQGDTMAVLLQHRGKRRSRAAAEVQTFARWGQSGEQWLDYPREESTVAGLIRIVLMQIVDRTFSLCIEMPRPGYMYQPAARAVVIRVASVCAIQGSRCAA